MKTELKHGYSGSCDPSKTNWSFKTFSVGIFQWVPRSSGEGFKKGKVLVRVEGFTNDPEKVYSKAQEICEQLDKGTYNGKKSVTA